MQETEIQIDPIEAMRMGITFRFPVRINKFHAHLRPLSITETIHVANSVTEKLMAMSEIERNAISENTLVAQETLCLAAIDPENPTKVPPINEFMLKRVTNSELEYLFKQYCAVVDKTNPALEELPVEKIQDMVEKIKKKVIQPIDLSFLDLANIVRFLLTNEDSQLVK